MSAKHCFEPSPAGPRVLDHREGIRSPAMGASEIHQNVERQLFCFQVHIRIQRCFVI